MTNWKPVIIIGAPRSGTNMLRDLLSISKDTGTWPCDEINPIWRYRNVHYPSDELPAALATTPVQNYIQEAFLKLALRQGINVVVEKTCANSLRVSYVNRILPKAKYIFLHRNAVDCVASAAKRWSGNFDLVYSARKARYIPVPDIPHYAHKYFMNRLHRIFSNKKRLATWGPISQEMLTLPPDTATDVLSAYQWRACVDSTLRDLSNIEGDRIYSVRYDDFVTDPKTFLLQIFDFLELDVAVEDINGAVKGVSANQRDKGRSEISHKQLDLVGPIVEQTMQKLHVLRNGRWITNSII